MKLVVGLGNPGTRFVFTRHNAGFMALDFYFKRFGLEWKENGLMGAIEGRTKDAWFVKPQGYYNDSGRTVAEYVRYYKIEPADVLVICDNFDLGFGKVRYRASGATGGNNGLKSVDNELGTNGYARVRIGTENDALREKLGAVDFVLSKFTPEEKEKLPEVLDEVCQKIGTWLGK